MFRLDIDDSANTPVPNAFSSRFQRCSRCVNHMVKRLVCMHDCSNMFNRLRGTTKFVVWLSGRTFMCPSFRRTLWRTHIVHNHENPRRAPTLSNHAPASRDRHLHKLATWSTPICFADRSGNCLFKVHVAAVLVLLEVQQQDALFAEQQSFPLAQALRIRRQLHLHRMPGNVLWKPTGDVSEVSCHTNSSFYE